MFYVCLLSIDTLEIIDIKYQEELLIQLRNDAEPAFNALYQAYSKPIWLRILRLVKDKDIADELLQEVFINIWKNRQQIDLEKSFKAFIYTVAQNLVYNYFRKNASDSNLLQNLLLQSPQHYMNVEQLMEERELKRLLDEAIDQLSPQRKRAFILCKVEGRSYGEASKIMGVSIATINSHITQSMQFLKEYTLKHLKVILVILFTGLNR
ncbi:RNA polymerase sigma factor [[Flexibacter] sp. ATCC 35208]|uniref:RNA polymerase sigma factor n=1 Tax=[Flexibacter] sp. ATCC 35208 TaxID=1936242 RepID=UPI001C6FCBAE|nr:sigma-70 family RNA polymerase sigma factor [[Flexibacter] sp. ATCC 35208]